MEELAEVEGVPGSLAQEHLGQVATTSLRMLQGIGQHSECVGGCQVLQWEDGHPVAFGTQPVPGARERVFGSHLVAAIGANDQETLGGLVGKERLDRMVPAADLVRAGARPGYGTDWLTVLPPNPWPIMQNLVTRKNAEHPEMGQLGEGHNLTVAEAIRMFTANGAYTIMAEDRIGSIEAGKQADMIVLDRNPLEIEPVTLNETKALKTLLGGRVVYDASKQTAPDVIDESEYYEAGRVVH